ncbi:trypsin-like peptidase domain-containing protein [Candidatus Woesearchaeota archaeon]|nr:trypsin-like peptidase domain-containing protein [Candidatus Woesearchaeota archaeon]
MKKYVAGAVITGLAAFFAYKHIDAGVKSATTAASRAEERAAQAEGVAARAESRAAECEQRAHALEIHAKNELDARTSLERRLQEIGAALEIRGQNELDARTSLEHRIQQLEGMHHSAGYDTTDALIDPAQWGELGKSVAMIEVEQRYLTENGGRNRFRFGNAVAIAADADRVYFATAAHNLDVELLGSTRTIKYHVRTGNRCEATVIAMDKHADVAIFSAPSNIPPLACGWAEPEEFAAGQLVLGITRSQALSENGILAYNPVVSQLKRITASKGYTVGQSPAELTFLTDLDIQPGESGAPAFVFQNGKPLFAGIYNHTYHTEKQNGVLNVDAVRKIMGDNGLVELVRK